MGWSSGSSIMICVIEAVKPHVESVEKRKAIYVPIIEVLEDGDWDTQDEVLGYDEAYDEIYREIYVED